MLNKNVKKWLKMLKNVTKISQNAFWDFLAASQKNVQKVSGKCPGAGAGAGKMSRKCQKSVPQTFSRHFFDTFWQIENQKGAREREARAPPFGWRPRAATSLLAKKCQKTCQKSVWKCLGETFFYIFCTFF